MMSAVDPRLKDALAGYSNSPTAGNRPAEATQAAVLSDPRKTMVSPNQDGYWDPSSKQYEYLGNADPGQDSGKYALHNALNDASSAASNMYYYGGSQDFANQQARYYNQLGTQLEGRTGPQANFDTVQGAYGSDNNSRLAYRPTSLNYKPTMVAQVGGYNQMVARQNDLVNNLQDIAAGKIVTPADQQLMASNAATQAGLRSQLASTQGGLLAAAAANTATKYASDAATSAAERNARMLRIAQANAAQDQLVGLTGAMRTQEAVRSQDVARLQNANTIRNANAKADADQMMFGALSRGLEGGIARQQARMDTYNTAVGNAGKYDKFNQEIADKNTNTFIGGVQGGFDAAGKLYTQMKSDSQTPDQTKKDGK